METPLGRTGVRRSQAGPPGAAGPAPRTAPAPLTAPAGPPGRWPVLAVISVGGAIGACARYGAGLLWSTAPDAFPWTTLLVNVVGCAVIGVFMVLITEGGPPHPLLRPFFGTGVLGGFTTFSTYTVDAQRLVTHGHATTALVYLVATASSALVSVWLAAAGARRALARRAAR